MFLYLIVIILFAWIWWKLFFDGVFEDSLMTGSLTMGSLGGVEGFTDQDNNHIVFLTADQTNALIAADADDYVDSLNVGDLAARNAKTVDEYKKIISNIGAEFNNSQTELLMRTIDSISADDLHIDESGWLNVEKFLEMPWHISLIRGTRYEYGWPHTRIMKVANSKVAVIMMPEGSLEKRDLKELLIHEQMHVYQKMYAADFQRYLDYHGFRRWGRKKNFPDMAANPDGDGWVYEKDGDVYCGKYVGRDKGKIRYFPVNSPRYDHPCEYAVY